MSKDSMLYGHITRREWLRFLSHTLVTDDGHWLWQGSKTAGGYGRLNWRKHYFAAHRFAYIALRGPIPQGFELDHLCRIRACANPDCVEPVTRMENILRGESILAQKMRRGCCKNGHPLNEINTWYRQDGSRRCRVCHRQTRELTYHTKNPLARVIPACGERHVYEYDSQIMTIAQWAKKLNISEKMIRNRIYRGWDIQRALTEPSHRKEQEVSHAARRP